MRVGPDSLICKLILKKMEKNLEEIKSQNFEVQQINEKKLLKNVIRPKTLK